MADEFNPYYAWLGIPLGKQPANHYRLLGLIDFEENVDVISTSADRQMAHVKTFVHGEHGELTQPLLNELSRARLCLSNQESKKQYDSQLLAQQTQIAHHPRKPAKSQFRWAWIVLPLAISALLLFLFAKPTNNTSANNTKQPSPATFAADTPTRDSQVLNEPALPSSSQPSHQIARGLSFDISRMRITNCRNGKVKNCGTGAVRVALFADKEQVWDSGRKELSWTRSGADSLDLTVGASEVTRARIEIWKHTGRNKIRAGLGEVEIFDNNGKNVALGCRVVASSEHEDLKRTRSRVKSRCADKIVDGFIEGQATTHGGPAFWLTRSEAATHWVELDITKRGFQWQSVRDETGVTETRADASQASFAHNAEPPSKANATLQIAESTDTPVDESETPAKETGLKTSANGRPGRFEVEVISSGAEPRSIDTGDLDGDGDLDIVAIYDNQLTWFENQSTGFKERPVRYYENFDGQSVQIADIDGDQDADIVFGTVDKLSWYRNHNNSFRLARFRTNRSTKPWSNVRALAAADIDGNGNIDVLVGDAFRLVLLTHQKDDQFSQRRVMTANTEFESSCIAAADIDSDGDADFAALNRSKYFYLFENQTARTFRKALLIFESVAESKSCILADGDSDGDFDILSSSKDGLVTWFENLGKRKFATRVVERSIGPDSGFGLAACDIDGDGQNEIIAGRDVLKVDGELCRPMEAYGTNEYVVAVRAADFDADGDTDLVVADKRGKAVLCFRNLSADK